MFTKRRSTRAVVSNVLLPALATLGLGSPANAAAGPHLTTTMKVAGVRETSTLPLSIPAGDCRLPGTNLGGDTYVYIAPIAGGDSYTVFWHGEAQTTFSIWGDIWHATFIFKAHGAGGTEVVRTSFQSSPMFPDRTYIIEREATVSLTPAQFQSIGQVTWVSDC